MTYFRGMEGMRAWLSWAVVFAHIIHMTGANHTYSFLKGFMNLGDFAVNVFIMISGFVITSLILEKKENYKTYISRRFLRIYPVYLICLIIGIFASELYAQAMFSFPWGEQTPPLDRLSDSMNSLAGNGYIYHIIAHLTMLHGAIPNDILYDSQYMFLAPAWSLSLEWQFYLVAPLIIALIQKPKGAIIAALAAFILLAAYQLGGFGFFLLHSILAGAGIFFGVGIGARFMMNQLPRLKTYPVAFMILALGCAAYGYKTIPFIIFMFLIIYILVDQPQDMIGKRIEKTMNILLDSKIAHYLGKISYSTYLVHAPVLQLLIYALATYSNLSLIQTVGVLCLTLPIITFICSALLNRYVEQPFINLGRKLFSQKS